MEIGGEHRTWSGYCLLNGAQNPQRERPFNRTESAEARSFLQRDMTFLQTVIFFRKKGGGGNYSRPVLISWR